MMHSLVGAEGFRKGTDLYFNRFDGQAVTTEDFVQSMEKANDIDLSQFRLWYSQAGTPELKVKQQYDAGRGVLTLQFQQSCAATPNQPHKQPFQIPVAVALFNQQGEKVESKTLVMSDETQSFDFGDLVDQPVVSLLRNFSAPVKVEFDQSDAELAHLVKHDDNGFTRWEAMQLLSLRLMLPAIQKRTLDKTVDLDEDAYQGMVQALNSLLDRQPEDKAILAEMLTLPSASYIAEQCKPIDPQCVVDVKEHVINRLSADLEAKLTVLYDANNNQEEFFHWVQTRWLNGN